MAPAPSKPVIAAAPSVNIDAFGSSFFIPSTAATAPAIFSASSMNPMTISLHSTDDFHPLGVSPRISLASKQLSGAMPPKVRPSYTKPDDVRWRRHYRNSQAMDR